MTDARHLDTSDPGLAAAATFAAAWLFAQTSMMNWANKERDRHRDAPAYGDESYRYVIKDAEKMAGVTEKGCSNV